MRHDLVVVANRLPISRDADGVWHRSPGGLVSALEPVMHTRGGAWIGWGETDSPDSYDGIALHPVPLSPSEVTGYYEGFANSVLWPAYHGLAIPLQEDAGDWAAYVAVNQRFAQAAARVADHGALVWIHDYHLHLVPAELRRIRPDLRIGFFLHIPMPDSARRQELPHLEALLRGTLGADLIGFQTAAIRDDFLDALCEIGLPDLPSRTAVLPISIDVSKVEQLAADRSVAAHTARLRASLGASTVLLSVDRLDHAKGIPQRLRALRALFADGRLDPASIAVVQVVVPSREGIDSYRMLGRLIAADVAALNADFGPVVRQWDVSVPFDELVALYRAADVMLVTPLRDGMNLVAKEYVAARTDNTGALVLSSRAGAALELTGAYLTDPRDVAAMADSIVEAVHADPKDRADRMAEMRAHLRTHDVHHWAAAFLTALDHP